MATRISRHLGVPYPEAAARVLFEFDANGKFVYRPVSSSSVEEDELWKSMFPINYSEISAPALAIYAVGQPVESLFGYYSQLDTNNKARALQKHTQWLRVWAEQRTRFTREMPRANVIEIPGASHYVYLSHTDRVETLMKQFLRTRA